MTQAELVAAAELTLRAAVEQADPLPLLPLALALAAVDGAPGLPLPGGLAAARAHIEALHADLAAEVAQAGMGKAADQFKVFDRLSSLQRVLYDRHGYRGDEATYDDLDNANLIRVIERRRGLPVALGILAMDCARSCGWSCVGLNFPGHFLIRLDGPDGRLIADPFDRLAPCDPPALRALVKRMEGEAAELTPAHHAPVADIEVLLRLENNIKLRSLKAGDLARAASVLRAIVKIAPDRPQFWRELGLIEARGGSYRAAIAALDRCLACAPMEPMRREVQSVLRELRQQLN